MIAAAVFVGWAYLLWVLFLAVMALRWKWGELSPGVKALALPAALVAFVVDIAFNLAASVLFLDMPREATFSQRMGRYKQGSGARRRVALWVCGNLLDPFDIGGHC